MLFIKMLQQYLSAAADISVTASLKQIKQN